MYVINILNTDSFKAKNIASLKKNKVFKFKYYKLIRIYNKMNSSNKIVAEDTKMIEVIVNDRLGKKVRVKCCGLQMHDLTC